MNVGSAGTSGGEMQCRDSGTFHTRLLVAQCTSIDIRQSTIKLQLKFKQNLFKSKFILVSI